MKLIELSSCIQYAARYFMLPLNYEYPSILQANMQSATENFEEFLAFQTHNNKSLEYVLKGNVHRNN